MYINVAYLAIKVCFKEVTNDRFIEDVGFDAVFFAGSNSSCLNDGLAAVIPANNHTVVVMNQQPPRDWVQLIRNLGWIGCHGEAHRLAKAESTLPPEQKGCVSRWARDPHGNRTGSFRRASYCCDRGGIRRPDHVAEMAL